jgi:hypothetical protein
LESKCAWGTHHGWGAGKPIDGAVLLVTGDSRAEKFTRADPYVRIGAVKRWYVREWTTVAGEGAAMPIRPKTVTGNKNANES